MEIYHKTKDLDSITPKIHHQDLEGVLEEEIQEDHQEEEETQEDHQEEGETQEIIIIIQED